MAPKNSKLTLPDLDELMNAAPPPFRMAEKKEWIVCEEPDLEGFAVLVRTSITNGEQDELVEKHDYISGEYSDEWNKLDEKEQHKKPSPRTLEKELIAPYVYAWNAQGLDPKTGEWKEVPAPAVAGPAAFEDIVDEAATWIIRVVMIGYLVTGKVRRLRNKSEPTTDTPPALESALSESTLPENSTAPGE